MLVKPSQLWSNLIKLGQTRFKLVLFDTGHYTDAFPIIETDASNIGYGGILKQDFKIKFQL